MDVDRGAQVSILGCRVDLLDMEGVLQRIKKYIKIGKPVQIVTLNAEICYKAQKDKELTTIINQADIVTADGVGVVWAARMLGGHAPARVTGIDLFYALCRQLAEKRQKIYLLGAKPGIAEKAAARIQSDFKGLIVAGCHDGYFSDNDIDDIITDIKETSPEVLFVALGAPAQEMFINKYKKRYEVPVSIGVGGTFDVVSGTKKRSPQLFIKLRLEWLYRLFSEPSRWKRQLVLPRFVIAVLQQKYSGNKARY